MNIAFITPEFVTEYGHGGGLGNYLYKISRVLCLCGHTVHVFVSSNETDETIIFDEIIVHKVRFPEDSIFLRLVSKLSIVFPMLLRAWILGRRYKSVASTGTFEFVQFPDYLAVGMFVPKIPGTVRVLRTSGASDLIAKTLGKYHVQSRLRFWIELVSMRRADIRYAPSQFISDYFFENHDMKFHVVRPPVYKRSRRIDLPIGVLPSKYFLFFGQLSEVNGFDWLCRTLPLVFAQVPDFRLVIVGVGDFRKVNRILESLGDLRSRVLILYPVASELIESYVENADGVIVPSRVSNLPNTLLEALTLNRPVIGSNGASVNELVVHNLNGLLVDIDDHRALAEAIITLWNDTSCVPKPGFTPEIERLVMDYDQNVEALLDLLTTVRSRG